MVNDSLSAVAKIADVHASSRQRHYLPFVHVDHHRKVKTRTAIK
jgi:hypothetical protein